MRAERNTYARQITLDWTESYDEKQSYVTLRFNPFDVNDNVFFYVHLQAYFCRDSKTKHRDNFAN